MTKEDNKRFIPAGLDILVKYVVALAPEFNIHGFKYDEKNIVTHAMKLMEETLKQWDERDK